MEASENKEKYNLQQIALVNDYKIYGILQKPILLSITEFSLESFKTRTINTGHSLY